MAGTALPFDVRLRVVVPSSFEASNVTAPAENERKGDTHLGRDSSLIAQTPTTATKRDNYPLAVAVVSPPQPLTEDRKRLENWYNEEGRSRRRLQTEIKPNQSRQPPN